MNFKKCRPFRLAIIVLLMRFAGIYKFPHELKNVKGSELNQPTVVDIRYTQKFSTGIQYLQMWVGTFPAHSYTGSVQPDLIIKPHPPLWTQDTHFINME